LLPKQTSYGYWQLSLYSTSSWRVAKPWCSVQWNSINGLGIPIACHDKYTIIDETLVHVCMCIYIYISYYLLQVLQMQWDGLCGVFTTGRHAPMSGVVLSLLYWLEYVWYLNWWISHPCCG
jgi:hypothetical protein